MKRLPLVVAAALAGTVSAVIFATTGGAAQQGAQTISLVTKDARIKLIDNPPKSATGRVSAGDYFVFTSKAFTEESDTRVGTSHGICYITAGGKDFAHASFLCNGAFALNDGIISWAQAADAGDDPTVTLAVTGGTGAYEGASGHVDSVGREDGTSLETIHLLP